MQRPEETLHTITEFIGLKNSSIPVKKFIDTSKISAWQVQLPKFEQFKLNLSQLTKYGYDPTNFTYPNFI